MKDARVDDYVGRAAEFAQPVLLHLRGLVHQACPKIEETIKWSRPFFIYRGAIVANMAAFKGHCSFGLWGPGMAATLRGDGVEGDGAGGSLGRIGSVKDLPKDKVILGWVREALEMAVGGASPGGVKMVGRAKAAKGELAIPQDLTAELAKIAGASAHFDALSPSCRKEYVEWIEGAKRAETRARRVAEATGWIAKGKRRNWKYEAC